MTLLIERLRWRYLSSKYCDIQRPKEWGSVTEEHKKMITSDSFRTHLLPIIERRMEQPRTRSSSIYLKECLMRENFTNPSKCPSLSGDPSQWLESESFASTLVPHVRSSGRFGNIVLKQLVDIEKTGVHLGGTAWCWLSTGVIWLV